MSGYELAKNRAEAGHRLRFYQDFYGRQWVKVHGGWKFWRSGKIFLDNQEVVTLKQLIAKRRRSGGESAPSSAPRSAADAA